MYFCLLTTRQDVKTKNTNHKFIKWFMGLYVPVKNRSRSLYREVNIYMGIRTECQCTSMISEYR